MFKNRIDAGERLAEELRIKYGDENKIVVLAIPRGGVVLGDVVARVLHTQLDIVISRKIGAPGNPELAIGAIVNNYVQINESMVREIGASEEYIKSEIGRQKTEMQRRRQLYFGDREPVDVTGKTAIIVDDGIATGSTALAAINAVKSHNPKQIVLAVPVSSYSAYESLKSEVDELVCLHVEPLFFAVGQFYEEFNQTSDSEVVDILKKYR